MSKLSAKVIFKSELLLLPEHQISVNFINEIYNKRLDDAIHQPEL